MMHFVSNGLHTHLSDADGGAVVPVHPIQEQRDVELGNIPLLHNPNQKHIMITKGVRREGDASTRHVAPSLIKRGRTSSFLSSGMPCMTTSLTEEQMDLGKPP